MEVTRTLAKFLVSHRYADLPQKVRHEGARSLLNWMGCAVGGSRHETVENALAALSDLSGPREATVLGRGDKLDIMLAALMNGTTSHTFDFDDTHLKTVIHPSGPVASALLALAERKHMNGKDFLHAFLLGVEAECRIGNAVYPSHYDVGWHITGTTGVFGAAVAIGKLLGLSQHQMVWTVGLAATQAAGIREMFGSMAKSFHPGRAAQNGYASALLARAGFTAGEHGLEGPRGFAAVQAAKYDLSKITTGLDRDWELRANTYKPFPCGI